MAPHILMGDPATTRIAWLFALAALTAALTLAAVLVWLVRRVCARRETRR